MVDLKNKEEVLKEMEDDILSLEDVDASLSSDIDVVKKALNENGIDEFQFVHESLKKDRNFIFNILDEDIALRAKDEGRMLGYLIEFVGEEFKNDKEFVKKCFDSAGYDVFPYVHEDLLKDFNFNKDIIITRQCDKEFLSYLDESLSSNEELIAICEEIEDSWQ